MADPATPDGIVAPAPGETEAGASRFEFRVFGEDLAGHAARLGEIARPEDPDAPDERRQDVYILGRDQVGASLKIRDGSLDLKLLKERRGALERWEPAGRESFPMPRETLETRFLVPAALFLAPFRNATVSEEQLLAAIAGTGAAAAIRVGKRRRRYRAGGVLAEAARLDVEGTALDTIAVEGSEPDAVEGLVTALGLGDAANESYASHLTRIAFGGRR